MIKELIAIDTVMQGAMRMTSTLYTTTMIVIAAKHVPLLRAPTTTTTKAKNGATMKTLPLQGARHGLPPLQEQMTTATILTTIMRVAKLPILPMVTHMLMKRS